MSLDFSYAWKTLTDSWPMYWYGIKITVLLAIVGTVFGLLIGLVVGAIRGIPEDPLDTPFRLCSSTTCCVHSCTGHR